jgi:TonB family protein
MSILGLCVLAGVVAGQGFEPARLRSGSVPDRPPVQATAGGEVLLEVSVDPDGAVAGVAVLRDTAPFTDLLREAVADWRFHVATEAGRPLAWSVLVAGAFRPAVLTGLVPRTPPSDVGTPCEDVPLPADMTFPQYPPTAAGEGMVLVEVMVETNGNVSGARNVHGPAAFAQAALDAARQWRFSPACRAGRAVSAVAYLVFGFRSPIMSPVPEGGQH